MRSVNLLKVAFEAELLRLRAMMARQARRAAFGATAVVFGLAVLTLAEIIGWQALLLKFEPLPATLLLLGVNLAIAAVFGVLAARSTPGHTEREALRVRREAMESPPGYMAFTAAVPAATALLGMRRGSDRRRSWLRPFGP